MGLKPGCIVCRWLRLGAALLCVSGQLLALPRCSPQFLRFFRVEKSARDFSTKIYIDGAATWYRWRGGASQFHIILETAVLWRLQLYLNFGRKIVADFSTRKNRKSWGENRCDAKSGPETYSSAAPNRNHLHAGQHGF
jgi:hypothetical protein